MTYKYRGADWLRSFLKVEMSEFGEKVADLLGDWQAGIYHMDTSKLLKADWASNHYIAVVHYGGLSTFDNESLTRLVVLCHDRCIRLGLTGRAKGYLELSFSPRQREGQYWERHATLEATAASIREHYGYGEELPA